MTEGAGSGCHRPLRSPESTVAWCRCLFKEAELCPEEVEKFRLPDLRLPATRRDQNLCGASEARAILGRAGRRDPRGEAAGCAGLARNKAGLGSPAHQVAAAQLLYLKHCLYFVGSSFPRLAWWAQGAPRCRVAITPAPTNCLAVH